jgi:hypothetical protein
MKREREEEMKTQRGGVSFFFFDLSNMTKATAGLYVLGIVGFFAIIFYVMFAKLFSKPVDFTKQKKQERLAKKSNSKTSSSSKKTQ